MPVRFTRVRWTCCPMWITASVCKNLSASSAGRTRQEKPCNIPLPAHQERGHHPGGRRAGVGQRWTRASLPAFEIQAVDTTGAGDAFHGAFAVCLLEGKSWQETLLYSSAAAACCCLKFGARPGMSTRQGSAELHGKLFPQKPILRVKYGGTFLLTGKKPWRFNPFGQKKPPSNLMSQTISGANGSLPAFSRDCSWPPHTMPPPTSVMITTNLTKSNMAWGAGAHDADHPKTTAS